MTTAPRSTTTPPQAKVVAAQGDAMAAILAQLTELAAVVCATWLLHDGKVDQTIWIGVIGYALTGQVIGKARGGPGGPTTIAVAGIGPWLAAAAKKTAFM